MKKLLYTTSALVGAAFLMEAVVPAKAEVNLSLRYRAALMSQSAKDEDKKLLGLDTLSNTADSDIGIDGNNSGKKHRSTNLTTGKINIGLSASKDHPNGLTTGASLSVTTGSDEKLGYDNAFGYISGSFGKVDIGSVRNIGYRSQGYGVPGTSNFGAVDAGFNPSIPGDAGKLGFGYINTSATYYVGGRASTIAYWSPSFSGAQVGVSWQPQSSLTGKASSFKSSVGNVEDAIAFSATYSGAFGGTGVSMGAAFATADVVKGEETLLSPEYYQADGSPSSVTGNDPTTLKTKSQDPTAYSGYISFDIGDFSVGGSYGAWEDDAANSTTTSEFTAFALGASYSVDALTFGLGWATRDEDQTDHAARTGLAASVNRATADKGAALVRKLETTTISFTTAYQLGDGAAVDFVMERTSGERNANPVDGKKLETSATGFGVGIDLKF